MKPLLASDSTRCNPFLALGCSSALNVGGDFSLIPADEDVGHCQDDKKVYWRQTAEFGLVVPGTCSSSDVGKGLSFRAVDGFTRLQSRILLPSPPSFVCPPYSGPSSEYRVTFG